MRSAERDHTASVVLERIDNIHRDVPLDDKGMDVGVWDMSNVTTDYLPGPLSLPFPFMILSNLSLLSIKKYNTAARQKTPKENTHTLMIV